MNAEQFNAHWAGSYRLVATTPFNNDCTCTVFTFEQTSPFGYWVNNSDLYIGEGGDYASIAELHAYLDNQDGGT